MMIVEIKKGPLLKVFHPEAIRIDQNKKGFHIVTQSGIEKGTFTEYSKQVRDGYYLIKIQEIK